MLLTKECDYGIRVIRALADGEKKTVQAICDVELVPVPYAYKILKKLEHVGLLRSVRGREGGYQLIASLHQITLYDIVTAIDENFFLFECVADNTVCPHHRPAQPCAVHLELDRLQSLLVAEMRSKTMHEVLFGSRKQN